MSQLPDILGSYRLSKFIRSGNSCQVWESIKDDGTGRYVLKILRQEHWGKRDEIGFLKHEFDVAGGLEHPNVIRIYEFKQSGKLAYLVLEIFSPLNLKQAMRESPELVADNFPKIAEQCMAGLAHLHSKGWVHCDVKPDNFLIDKEAKIKLIDFTISRKAAKGLVGKLFGGSRTICGTRSYMSPEQIRKQPVDGRADVYSMGCMLYELLSGKAPYTGDSPNDLLQRHLSSAVPAASVNNSDVTQEASDLIREMMGKKPEHRPKSMDDALARWRATRIMKIKAKRD